MKKIFALLMVLLMLVGCGTNEEVVVTEKGYAVREINKYGSLILKIPASEFRAEFEPGDIADVKINDSVYTMPVGTSYSDVDTGAMVLRLDEEDDETFVAINHGSFIDIAGLDESVAEVFITMNTKAGYLDEYKIRNLVRTYEREDYPELSDEEYANFRMVKTTGIKEDTLYRSSSPVDPDLNRNTYADTAMKNVGIKTVINVDDEKEEMLAYEGYADTYYSSCKIFNFPMEYDFTIFDTRMRFGDITKMIIQTEAPYLLHCKEGKDRTGIAIALLEMIMGATLEEVEEDYMETYINFYKVEKGSDTYNVILKNVFEKSICNIFEVESLEGINLQEKAEEYILGGTVAEWELALLKEKLS